VQDDRLAFDRQADGRTKTSRAAIGTLAQCGAERLPEAVLFRTRTGHAYRDERSSRDFCAVRDLALPGDQRLLMDMRSGVVALAQSAISRSIPTELR
jgi:hypothetical protein